MLQSLLRTLPAAYCRPSQSLQFLQGFVHRSRFLLVISVEYKSTILKRRLRVDRYSQMQPFVNQKACSRLALMELIGRRRAIARRSRRYHNLFELKK
ncbi:hypothetical protein [Oscillatoria sp. FACHB-1406]|uniref:hypothetical protein n=1 Tax=Oscillatoria sp. FACHB-1406 TaxID=2692846 RepID=UPI001687A18C|nr:hypothetical protein [Oscillatoria sp. FACHB-1406]MBD2577372.1 hypothetical protein [Oscillatoria sp. FACHB-1406]